MSLSDIGYRNSIDDRIRINFEHFELEHPNTRTQNCVYDFLEIREGGTANGPLVGRFVKH